MLLQIKITGQKKELRKEVFIRIEGDARLAVHAYLSTHPVFRKVTQFYQVLFTLIFYLYRVYEIETLVNYYCISITFYLLLLIDTRIFQSVFLSASTITSVV